MRTLLALTIVLAPLIARADDELGPVPSDPAEAPPADGPFAQPPSEGPYAPSEGPYAEPPPSEAPYAEPPYAEAPPSEAPIVTPAAPAAAPRQDKHHCAHSRWSHRHRWSDSRKRGTLAVGLSKGLIGMGDDRDGSQESLFFRLQTRRGWGAELELARATINEDKAKTVGGALYKAWGRRLFQPYIIAGLGRGTVERAYGGEDRMRYYEAGGGLLLRGRHLAIGIDIRKGISHVDGDAPMAAPARMTTSPTATEDRDDYVRGRVLAMFAF